MNTYQWNQAIHHHIVATPMFRQISAVGTTTIDAAANACPIVIAVIAAFKTKCDIGEKVCTALSGLPNTINVRHSIPLNPTQ